MKKLVSLNTAKSCISASRFCCRLASYIPSKFNNDVVKILTDNASHKMVQVRVETAIALRELLVEGGFYEFAALNALKKLIKDPQSSVQIFAFETLCWRAHSKQYYQTAIFGLVMSCLEVKNWRIRYVLVRQLACVLGSLEAKNRKPIVAYYAKYLADPEVEVSILAIKTLKNVLNLIDLEDLIEKILPEITKLISNENADIKLALCLSVPSIASVVVKVPEALNQIKNAIGLLAKDPNPDVKARLLLNIEPYLKTLASSSINNQFAGIIYELLADKNWKIRVQGIKALEQFVIKFPEDFAQDDRVMKVFNDKLTDRIANVRKSALKSLKTIAQSQGAAWTEKNLLPIIHAYVDHPNYLYRYNFLYEIGEVVLVLAQPTQLRETEIILKLTKDAVANIRFKALLTLLKIAQRSDDKGNEERLRRAADALIADPDNEVKRFAKNIVATKDTKQIVEKQPDFNS